MSKVGKLPVAIPAGVTVNVANGLISVKGPKGELKQSFHDEIDIKVEGTEVVLATKNSAKQTNAYHGLYRSLINNMVKGVTDGFTKTTLQSFQKDLQLLQLQMENLQCQVSTSSWLENSVLRYASCASLNLTKERVSAMRQKLSDVKSVRLVLNKVKLYV